MCIRHLKLWILLKPLDKMIRYVLAYFSQPTFNKYVGTPNKFEPAGTIVDISLSNGQCLVDVKFHGLLGDVRI